MPSSLSQDQNQLNFCDNFLRGELEIVTQGALAMPTTAFFLAGPSGMSSTSSRLSAVFCLYFIVGSELHMLLKLKPSVNNRGGQGLTLHFTAVEYEGTNFAEANMHWPLAFPSSWSTL